MPLQLCPQRLSFADSEDQFFPPQLYKLDSNQRQTYQQPCESPSWLTISTHFQILLAGGAICSDEKARDCRHLDSATKSNSKQPLLTDPQVGGWGVGKVGMHRLEIPHIPDLHIPIHPCCGHVPAEAVDGNACDWTLHCSATFLGCGQLYCASMCGIKAQGSLH